ncbi:hypothetical protein PAPYR_2957 [Paratrimastix pyriformis]|uniref:POPDC1-3 domain-containing protein n=1 Tax=Paratrimastix pyriformis TaxID=342808 RepID=A0ABQ8UNG9_9EUKA|nr:hypothetical protein PAPYR_2957 [Paratrimastix pyriformis]
MSSEVLTTVLYHVAQVFFLFSYLSWGELFLRGCLTGAFLFLLLYAIFLGVADNIAGIVWSSLFILINLLQVARLAYARRPIWLSPEEETAFTAAFSRFGAMTRREFRDLWRVGTDRILEDDEVLCKEGEAVTFIGFLVRGRVAKMRKGHVLNSIAAKSPDEWSFLCNLEYIFHTRMGMETPLHLTRRGMEANTKTHLWELRRLQKFFAGRPQLRDKFTMLISMDLVRKLQSLDENVSQHHRLSLGLITQAAAPAPAVVAAPEASPNIEDLYWAGLRGTSHRPASPALATSPPLQQPVASWRVPPPTGWQASTLDGSSSPLLMARLTPGPGDYGARGTATELLPVGGAAETPATTPAPALVEDNPAVPAAVEEDRPQPPRPEPAAAAAAPPSGTRSPGLRVAMPPGASAPPLLLLRPAQARPARLEDGGSPPDPDAAAPATSLGVLRP